MTYLVCFSIIALISFDNIIIIYDVLNCWFAYGYFRLCKNSYIVDDYDVISPRPLLFRIPRNLNWNVFSLAFLLQYFLRFIGIFCLKIKPFSRYLRWYLHSSHRKCVQLMSFLLVNLFSSHILYPYVSWLIDSKSHRACYILKLLLQLWHHCDIFHASNCCVISHPLAPGFSHRISSRIVFLFDHRLA